MTHFNAAVLRDQSSVLCAEDKFNVET